MYVDSISLFLSTLFTQIIDILITLEILCLQKLIFNIWEFLLLIIMVSKFHFNNKIFPSLTDLNLMFDIDMQIIAKQKSSLFAIYVVISQNVNYCLKTLPSAHSYDIDDGWKPDIVLKVMYLRIMSSCGLFFISGFFGSHIHSTTLYSCQHDKFSSHNIDIAKVNKTLLYGLVRKIQWSDFFFLFGSCHHNSTKRKIQFFFIHAKDTNSIKLVWKSRPSAFQTNKPWNLFFVPCIWRLVWHCYKVAKFETVKWTKLF